MAPLLINDKLRAGLMHAIGNTLVHSLWQGILLALVAGVIVLATKKQSAAMRYNMLVAALALFSVTVIITFAMQFAGVPQLPVAVNPSSATVITQTNNAYNAAPAQQGFISILSAYLNNHYNIIVLVWFLIICAKSVQLGVGLYGTYRLKYVSVTAAPLHWQARMQQLAETLHVKQGIRLLQSGLAKVPLVIGHLKPVILMPAGLLNNLSTPEIEAILMHELAHVRRRDYLVNLLQSCMEVVLFFNPAVLWVSQLIKAERENCCDDLVVNQGSNKVDYIRALLNCEEYRLRAPLQAVAFPGNRSGLLQRARRMADNRNHSLNIFEKTILVFCLVTAGIGMSAFAKQHPAAVTQNTILGNYAAQLEKEWARADSLANESIAADLLDDGIITDKYNLSFKLSGKTFIVNGIKQEEDVFKRYAARYVPEEHMGSGWTWSHVVTDKNAGKGNTKVVHAKPPYSRDMYRLLEKKQQILVDAITNDMMHDGIITQARSMDFTISARSLIVNGKKLDDATCRRYMAKYSPAGHSADWSWGHSNHDNPKE